MATNYLVTIMTEDIKHPDKLIEKGKESKLFGGNVEGLAWEKRKPMQLIADPSSKFRIACYPVAVHNLKKNITKDQAETALKKNVAESEKGKITVVACGTDPMADLATAGYEPVPMELPE